MEQFFLQKIAAYRSEFTEMQAFASNLENELIQAKQQELASLMVIQGLKRRVKELETKNAYYKNRLEKEQQSNVKE